MALMVLAVDQPVPAGLLERLRATDGIASVHALSQG
jgi:hypothetical protein